MQSIPLQPLVFEPILRRLIWGGRRLGTLMGKPIGDGDDYAESWEIADYHDSVSVVRDGPLAGTTLRDLVRTRPAQLFGRSRAAQDQFPLLIKLIDAREPLSVQVHPDDALARTLAGDSGKTEAWVVIDAEPGSLIYAGLKAGVDRDQLERAVRSGDVEPLLHRFEPRAGDCVMVEAGTVHAIGAGVLLAEVQQTSDATFRVFDWNRHGADGKPRELHIDQALQSINFGRGPVDPLITKPLVLEDGNVSEALARCPYFQLERWTLGAPQEIGRDDRFTVVMVLSGEVRVSRGDGELSLGRGATLLLPASISPHVLSPIGQAVVLTCQQP
ncbi:MAG: class I mannose-6-phosphate isomerase [Paludisphaera borealis]|uniref:type I phosphomannose isomerase catalytic subunit n=1 Tax=Paludisphaera borealis TaxID=1387353 RepID=UPI002849D8B1|nr:type I phosphomannose isomerase catalytic subunit [Paludisphaera borealis]MDR3618937.1 class I mannose-6-phosphate isomerase [Paludisphaera borealis]